MALLLTSTKTPVGNLFLVADQHVLLGANFSGFESVMQSLEIEFGHQDVSKVKNIPVISDLISDYFDGDVEAINAIAVRQSGASFSQAAWKAMRKVKAGKTLSYAELAQRAGSPAAVRASGSACAKNAVVIVVPCHRIVKTGGALGNYAYGLDIKEWLLRHESAL
ncbi:MAG: methylated-DNA--[protein]-cysteine S-methyltransferase [Actinobacteria bacterium]|nr:methylated-DNA--[protein]-cysteine S-methyltransferase [Actinomycetota bacterium]